jgi:hypothetical protein
MEFEYSEKEHRLFKYFKVDYLAGRLSPKEVYREAIVNAFVDEYYMDCRECESLRKAYVALIEDSVKRMTPEFDALIRFEYDEDGEQ